MKSLIALLTAASLLGACTGTGIDFEPNFRAVDPGATKTQVLNVIGSPRSTESYDVAGFTLTRMEIVDLRQRYVFITAGTPLSEARLVSKSQLPLISCK